MKKDKESTTSEESTNNNCGATLSEIFGITLDIDESSELIENKVGESFFQEQLSNEVPVIELCEKLDFSGKEKLYTGSAKTPFEHFQLFLSNDFFKILTIMTNKHVIKKGKQCDKIKTSEIKTYIGIRFYMSICKLPCYDMYWETKEESFGQVVISRAMTRSRFEAIKSNFSIYDVDDNFTKNDSTLADKAILYFNSVFGSKYSPGRDLSIDEGICSWKGKLRFKTYNPQKPDKYGIKLYMLCDSKTGYTLKFTLCSGGKTINETVLDLLDNYFEKLHIIYMDNYYNSIKLTEVLHEKHVYVCSPLRANRGFSRAF
ncbi:PiggyBac transposable element-derived protein 4 [Cucumispora dikerogammari]|nr:PiggyBac transposable element-derived protein 4 [Cucumispora dikerogammari]